MEKKNNFTSLNKVDDRWKKHNNILDKIPSESLSFLKNPYFSKIITMPLKKNTKMCRRELKILLNHFKDLRNVNVLEVGAGFGNFCRVFCKKIKVSSYTILDTSIMLKFAKTFLSHHRVNCVNYVGIDKFKTLFDMKFNLFISITCMSETPKDYRTSLLNNIFPNCDRIFMIEADKRAHPKLNGGHFNEWFEKTIRQYFSRVKIEEIPYEICYQKHSHIFTGEKLTNKMNSQNYEK